MYIHKEEFGFSIFAGPKQVGVSVGRTEPFFSGKALSLTQKRHLRKHGVCRA